MPQPKTYQRLQSELGIFNYQRDFIEMYAEIAQPWYDLLEIKNIPTAWIKKNGTVNGKYEYTWTPEGI